MKERENKNKVDSMEIFMRITKTKTTASFE